MPLQVSDARATYTPTSGTNDKALMAGLDAVCSRLQVSDRAIANKEPNSTVFSLGVIAKGS